MLSDLTGKNILITGASSGLGRAVAVACAESGARVVLVGRNEERLEETRAQCSGGDHVVQPRDLGEDLDGLPRFVSAICKQVGPLSGFVHSAGVFEAAALRMVRSAQMAKLFTINTASAILLTKGVSLRNNHTDGTSVVYLTSIIGHRALPGSVAYAASKMGLTVAAKSLALELIQERMRVNCIAPGIIETPLVERYYETSGGGPPEFLVDMHPGGFGRPADVAAAALYLLSDHSAYVTGTTLFVDGGATAR